MKMKVLYRPCVHNAASRFLEIDHKSKKWQWCHNLSTWCHCQFFFEIAVFLLPRLVAGPSLMSISLLVLELWQFFFIRDWPEIWKSEILPSELCPIFDDWGELGIPNLAWMSLMKCFWCCKMPGLKLLRFLSY